MFRDEIRPTSVPTFIEMSGSNERSFSRVEQPYRKIRVYGEKLGLGVFKRNPMEIQIAVNSISNGECLRERRTSTLAVILGFH